ncbi:hypothetical protein [Gallaecimonas sp. GXIMD4217]|uniref:hypothetical protein n=1 Tax=Gallaecimonas sp. GXIMD4217 TaxID=3131927 RepID=UPI00311ABCD6
MILLAIRFLFFTFWVFPLYRGCQKRHPDDQPGLFVVLVTLFTSAWVVAIPGNQLLFFLGWFTLPWLAWGLVKSMRSKYRNIDKQEPRQH